MRYLFLTVLTNGAAACWAGPGPLVPLSRYTILKGDQRQSLVPAELRSGLLGVSLQRGSRACPIWLSFCSCSPTRPSPLELRGSIWRIHTNSKRPCAKATHPKKAQTKLALEPALPSSHAVSASGGIPHRADHGRRWQARTAISRRPSLVD